MSVEQILNTFQQRLELDAGIFLQEARRVAEYDAILRDAQRDLIQLTASVQSSMLQQETIETTLQGIDAFQHELDDTLVSMEDAMDAIFAAVPTHGSVTSGSNTDEPWREAQLVPTEADVQREKTFRLVQATDQNLQAVQANLQSMLAEMQGLIADRTMTTVTTNESGAATTTDLGPLVQILHQHENSIVELEQACRRTENDLTYLQQAMHRGSQQQQRPFASPPLARSSFQQ
jgi:Nsp1-like C-terminal region